MDYATTLENYFVLDKNVLRPPNGLTAKSEIDSAASGALVIDTTFIEQARTGKFVDQYEKDFRDWTDNPSRMSISWGVGELMREEKDSGKRANTIVDAEGTLTYQSLLDDLRCNNLTRLQNMESKVVAQVALEKERGGRLDAKSRLDIVKGSLDLWHEYGSSAGRKSIIEEVEDKTEPPLLGIGSLVLSDRMATLLEQRLATRGYAAANARALFAEPSFTGMLHYTMEAYTIVLWAQGQRLGQEVNPEKHLNQYFDLDYVAYSLCCRGLKTQEKMMRRLEAGLRQACDNRWPRE